MEAAVSLPALTTKAAYVKVKPQCYKYDCIFPVHLSSSHPWAPQLTWCVCVRGCVHAPPSVQLPLSFTFTHADELCWVWSASTLSHLSPLSGGPCFAGNRLSTHALTRACAPSSVHGAGDVWNRVASEVLQLQQEGPLPVGKQFQQHRVRMQAQRHAHAHVGQQGDVCVKGRSARCSGEQEQSRGGVSVSVSPSGEDVFDASCR